MSDEREQLKLHHLRPAPGSKKAKIRVGRGEGGRRGKTAGRGTKGLKARSKLRPGFEGGQMPLIRRVPKRGFTNIFRSEYEIVNVAALAELEGEVTPELLAARGLVRPGRPVKVLGQGEPAKKLTVKAHKFSATARRKIEQAGGSCEVLGS